MNIKEIQQRVRNGDYLIKSHAIQHALKEGFQREHIVEAILTGKIIELYMDEHRVLICGKTTLSKSFVIYLHVVCEFLDPVYIECITAYIPDEEEWESPPFKRRRIIRR